MNTCLYCGKETTKKYCNRRCYWDSLKGVYSENLKEFYKKQPKATDREKICPVCGKTFKCPYRFNIGRWKKTKYCSIQCASIGKRKRVILDCVVCGKPFETHLSRKDKYVTCSKECHDINKRENSPKGEKAPGWRGGITPAIRLLRESTRYVRWRKKVYERDNYTCQECGATGVYLNAHHIKPFILFPEYRFDLSNGITLCLKCHAKTETYGNKIKTYLRKELFI